LDTGKETHLHLHLSCSLGLVSLSRSQSMNFVCALLLLFMDEEDAFWLLATMVEVRPLPGRLLP
jgi:hypothetical protein